MRINGADGHAYMTAGELPNMDGYADITPARLRAWRAAGHLQPVTVAQMAAALGAPAVAAGVDPDAPAYWPGPSGREYVYRWADIVRAETATRLGRRARGGRPRGATRPHRPVGQAA